MALYYYQSTNCFKVKKLNQTNPWAADSVRVLTCWLTEIVLTVAVMVETDGRRPSQAQAGYVRGHKPTPSQESNTLSQVSCYTTISQLDSEGRVVQTTSADSLATVTGEVTSLASSRTSANSVLQQPVSPSQWVVSSAVCSRSHYIAGCGVLSFLPWM